MQDQELTVAVLGAGNMARKHAANLQEQEGVRITAFCATTRESAERAAGEFSGATGYRNFEQMLDEQKPRALVVALPPHVHTGQVEMAAERGLALFLEKPLALDPARAESMAAAVQKTGVPCVMVYQLRFADPVRRLKMWIEDGTAGQPVLFTGSYASNSLHHDWWRDKTKGGGQLIEQAIHIYDMGLHLCGLPTQISAQVDNLVHRDVPDYTVDDVSAAVLRYCSRAIGSITANNAAVPWEWNARFELVCENLTARVAGDLSAEFIFSADPDNVRRETLANKTDPYKAAAHNFVQTVRGEAVSLAPVDEGLAGLLTVHAAMTSAQHNGAPQNLNH